MTYKLFESGETLTANDVQTYFMDQVVIHVATEADLADLIADHENVRVAYAQDTDKVYALVSGSWEALAYEGGDFTFDDLTVTGNLTVTGTTTTVDSTTIQVKDKFVFEGATADAYETTLQVAEPTADRTITLPDATGTVALTSNIPSLTGYVTETGTQTLTNKTISGSSNTLSNIPNNALTNSSITIDGSSVVLGGTATIIPTQTGNSGKYLTTNGTVASWETVDLSSKTDKSTLTTTGDIYYASSANTPARLGIGSTDQVLKVSGGIPAWGAAPAPTAVGCYVYNNVAISCASGSYTTLTFNSEYFDTDAIHSTSTNTSRLTVPTGLGGKWVIFTNIYCYSVANGYYTVKFQVNGNDKNRQALYHFGNSNAQTIAFSQPFSLNAGDYVEVLLYQNTGANRNADTDEYGGFGMMRIGA
jgi:hypothetical protein